MSSSSKSNNRKPYNGDTRGLAIAFDVGTTFSGVSYAFLDKGEVPQIHGVTRYPGQEHVTGNTKIPSLLYYDQNENLVAAGAEADNAQAQAQAEDEGWFKVELFKLRLRPRRMQLDMNGMRLSPLPPGKSSEDVFGDFLAYLFACTRKFIEDTHANGQMLWGAVHHNIHFVLSHPNGWEGAQQSRMRRSAIKGGLIPNTDEGKARIRFVTEGEASMHACILSGLAHDVLASGNGFIVADAGGGTLDVSSYILRGTHPLQIEEVAPPDCVFSGAVFVSRRCRVFLAEKLRGSKYGTDASIDHITKRFDETTKRLFRDRKEPQYIPFGSPLDKDSAAGIRSGQLKLTGDEVAELFEPSIEAAVQSVRRQVEMSRGAIKAVWLVGGFAASPWLFSQLTSRLAPIGVTVNRPDSQTSKAVADGAIGFFCDHHVSARMARYMYGVEYLREIDVNDKEHLTRVGRQLQLPSGPKYLPDAFDCILAKNTRVKESSVFSRKYYTEVTKLSTLSVFEIEIWCYRGPGDSIPKWIDRNSDYFGSLCFVRADLSRLSNSAEPKRGANGQTYWTVVFSIEIHFGLTEFKARMKWNEDGRTRYGPATIVFNEKGVRSDEDDAFSALGGADSTPASPRRPYGSLVSHSTRRGKERSKDMTSDLYGSAAPSAANLDRTLSGTTDTTDVDTVTHDQAPPVAGSVSSSRKSRSKGMGPGSVRSPSLDEVPPAAESVRGPSPPALHSRTPSMAAPSMHSRQPSAAPLPSRPPTVTASPMHSRAPSIAAPPSMHSRAPSVVPSRAASTREREPSPPPRSRAPSAAPTISASPSRAPSLAPPMTHSRAPSAAGGAPVPSRTPSSYSRPPISRNPSSASRPPPSPLSQSGFVTGPPPGSLPPSRVPTVTRQSSHRGYTPSNSGSLHVPGMGPEASPSHHDEVEDEFVDVNEEPEVGERQVEGDFLDVGPPGGFSSSHTRTRSISPSVVAPPEEPAVMEEPPMKAPSKATSRRTASKAGSVVASPPIAEQAPPPVARSTASQKSKTGGGSGWGFGWGGFGGGEKQEETALEDFGAPQPHPDTGTTAAEFYDAIQEPAPEPETEPAPVVPEEPPAPEPEPAPEPTPEPPAMAKSMSAVSKTSKKGGKKAKKAEEEAAKRAQAEEEARQLEAAAAEAEAERQRAAEEAAALESEKAELAAQEAQLEAERQRIAEEQAAADAEAERVRLETEAAEIAKLEQEVKEAEARAAEEEAAAAKKAEDDAAAAEEAARAAAEAEAEAHAQAEVAKAAEAEAEAAAAAAAAAAEPQVDEQRKKLEADVEKAEKDVEAAQADLDKNEAALAKAPKAKPKGKNKKAVPTMAEKAAEKKVQESQTKLDRAKEKLAKAEKALEEHGPPAAAPTPPPPVTAEPNAEAEEEYQPPSIPSKTPSKVGSKAPSNAFGNFETGGGDDLLEFQPSMLKKKSKLDEIDMGGSGSDEHSGNGDNLGLWGTGGGGGGGGWGTAGGGGMNTSQSGGAGGGGWGFSSFLDKGKGSWGF